jgi:hypothetical protein
MAAGTTGRAAKEAIGRKSGAWGEEGEGILGILDSYLLGDSGCSQIQVVYTLTRSLLPTVCVHPKSASGRALLRRSS